MLDLKTIMVVTMAVASLQAVALDICLESMATPLRTEIFGRWFHRYRCWRIDDAFARAESDRVGDCST